MEIKAGQLDAKLQEGRATETKMENDKRELSVLRSKIPVSTFGNAFLVHLLTTICCNYQSFDTQESSLRAKIEELKSSQREEERRLGDKLSAAEEQFTVLNGSVLELDSIQSRIEKWVFELESRPGISLTLRILGLLPKTVRNVCRVVFSRPQISKPRLAE